MRDPTERVEIVDPPIGELTRRHRSFARACFTGCLFVVVFIVAGIVGVRLFLGAGPRTLTAVPATFPKDIPLYDRDAIERITFIPAQYKNRALKLSSLVPQLVLSPLLPQKASGGGQQSAASWKDAWQIITAPIGDNTDVVQIEWQNLQAEANFIASYYSAELRKHGYAVSDRETTQPGTGRIIRNFSFQNPNGITGDLSVEDQADTNGTDYAVLTVHISPGN